MTHPRLQAAWLVGLAIGSSVLGSTAAFANGVGFYDFNTPAGFVFDGGAENPSPFTVAFDGDSSWNVTGANGDAQGQQFGVFGSEFDFRETTGFSMDLVINPGNQATSFAAILQDFDNVATDAHPAGRPVELAVVDFDLTGLAPGPHTVQGTTTLVNGATQADLFNVEQLKFFYFPGTDTPANLTLEEFSAVGGFNAYAVDFDQAGVGSVPANFGSFSDTNGLFVSENLATVAGEGVDGTQAIELTVDARFTEPNDFWVANVNTFPNFNQSGLAAVDLDELELAFDLNGSVAASVEIVVQTLDSPSGSLTKTIELAAADTYESFAFTLDEFEVGDPGFDLENNKGLQVLWTISSDTWGASEEFSLLLDNFEVNGVPAGGGPAGDYNGDGNVDAADYTVWRDSFGSTVDLSADGDDSGEVDAADYGVWAANYGLQGATSAFATPEPTTAILTLFAGVLAAGGRSFRQLAKAC